MVLERLFISNHHVEIFGLFFCTRVTPPFKSLQYASSRAGVFNLFKLPWFQVAKLVVRLSPKGVSPEFWPTTIPLRLVSEQSAS